MPDLDRLFEENLNRLMAGVPLEDVVSDLPDDALELLPLLSLAAQTHGIRHPQMDPLVTIRLRSQVLAAASAGDSQPVERGAAAWQPRPPLERGAARWQLRPILAGLRLNRLSIAIALLIVIAVGLSLAVYGPVNSHYAVMTDISGSVQLAAANGSGANQNASKGSHIQQGQRLITAPGSTVTLVFFDGSRMVIGPSSDIILTTVKGGWGKQLMVTVNQLAGSTRSSVVPSSSPEAYYSVNTPSGQASVHGATFNVDVASNGKSYFSVDRGRIQVVNASASVVVPAGQAIAALPKQQPAAPAYSFEVNGSLVSITGELWSVSNLTFKITPQTILPVQYQVGDTISVKGHIGSESILVADWIRVSKNTQTVSSFSGIVEANSSTLWQITGQPLMVNPETVLGSGIKVGDPVNVSFIIQPDGRWRAKTIQRLITDPENKPTATPTSTSSDTPTPEGTTIPTPSESPMPSVSPSPSESPSPSVSPSPFESSTTQPDSSTTAPGSSPTAPVPSPTAPDLSPTVPGSSPTAPDLSPTAPGSSPTAPDLSPTAPGSPLTVPGAPPTVPGSSPTAPSPSPTVPGSSPTAPSPSPTVPESSPTAPANQTTPPGLSPTPPDSSPTAPAYQTTPPGLSPTAPDSSPTAPGSSPTAPANLATPTILGNLAGCVSSAPHQPEGVRLSQQYYVTYEEIMGWFCQGYGFSEIDQAYSLSLNSGYTPADLFAMRASGMGWGQIRLLLRSRKATKVPGVSKNPSTR